MTSQRFPLVRTLYLYLFSTVGIVLMVIGGVSFVQMALRAWVFPLADREERISFRHPPMIPFDAEKVREAAEGGSLTQDERAAVRRWLAESEAFEERRDAVDPITAQRHREASRNLAMIAVGLPLYFYHWRVVTRESDEKRSEKPTV